MWKWKCRLYLYASDGMLCLARLALRIANRSNARSKRLTNHARAVANRARVMIGGEDE